MGVFNLNQLTIPTDSERSLGLADYSERVVNPHFDSVEVIFKNQQERLVEIINDYPKGVIFGCIAWLTSKPVLKAFANCENVQILVQKEDFLRPDFEVEKARLRDVELWKLYGKVTCKLPRSCFRPPMGNLSLLGNPTVQGIRCVGNHNSDKTKTKPRAHHKFLVFCRLDGNNEYHPEALWTGSFNLTDNATRSFENVTYFEDKSGTNEIISAFLKEHHQIFALSESLNWTHRWAAPEYRIGT
jgi:hypothetical protein